MAYSMPVVLCMSVLGYTLVSGSALNHNDQSASFQRQAVDASCVDNPVCANIPDICSNTDNALVATLCPVMCGLCPTPPTTTTTTTTTPDPYPGCHDSARLNCTHVKHQICTFDSAFHLCPRTCDLCDRNPTYHPCKDNVQGLQCAELPHACDDAVGLISCPLFCGVCAIPTDPATPATTLPTTPLPVTRPFPVTMPTSGPCDFNPCINGGTCFSNSFRFICACPEGYSGPSCNVEPPPTTTTTPTTTATTASTTTTTPPITATTAHTYTTSPLSTTATAEHCHCHNGGVCRGTAGGGVECLCPPGFVHPVCDPATPTTIATTTAAAPMAPTTTQPDCYVRGKEFMYQGHVNVSSSGKPCQVWSDHHRSIGTIGWGPADFSDGLIGYNSNFCRHTLSAPRDSYNVRPICYVKGSAFATKGVYDLEFCPIPECSPATIMTTATTSTVTTATAPMAPSTTPAPECYVRGQEFIYQGHANVSISGKPCQVWSDHHRHSGTFGWKPEQFSDGLLGYNSNFCRFFGATTLNTLPLPVCYSEENGLEFCDVPAC